MLCSTRLAGERDSAERDSREKETRILNLTRQLDDLRNHVAEMERNSQQQQSELAELISSKDDVGKNVREILSCHGYYIVVCHDIFLSTLPKFLAIFVISLSFVCFTHTL